MNLSMLAVLFFALAIQANAQTYTRPVNTESGTVVGEVLHTVIKKVPYLSFRGIPYAEPPTGELRFKSPVPKKPWKGTLNATSDPDRCIQADDDKKVYGSEDCLYLNVYQPNNQNAGNSKSNLKPVLVWVHGGAFKTGYAAKSYYGPDFLVEEDIVVVTMQYRLGPLGFLNSNYTGNFGLKDQNLALRWVKKNIANFGGNPNQVTLMGQSAGGVSVDLHKLSNSSAGLFQQTISMSASPLCNYWPFQSNVEAKTQASLLGSKLGFKSDNETELLNFLTKNVTANDMIKAASELPAIPFRPTLEKGPNAFLTECTPKLYKEGKYNKGPHMMGFTKNEILFMVKSLDDLIEYHENAAKSIRNSNILGSTTVVPKIISTPFKGIAGLKKAAFSELIDELSDIYFVSGIDMKQKLLVKHNNAPVYYYRYLFQTSQSAHKSEGINILDGVAHEDELPLLFLREHVEMDLNNPRIASMRNRMVKLWTNFVKYGNPTPNGASDPLLKITWPESGKNGTAIDLNDTLTIVDRPVSNLVSVYQKLGFGGSKIYNDCDDSTLSDIVNSLANIPGKALEVVDDIADAKDKVKEGITDVKDKVTDGITDAKEAVSDVVSDAKKKSVDVISDAKKKIPVIG